MTERTRWDALAEELKLKEEPADPQVEPCMANPEVSTRPAIWSDEIPYMERVGMSRNDRYVDGVRLRTSMEASKPYTKYARVASDPPTTSSSEGKVTWDVLRAQTLVMLMVDGVSIGPVTDVSMAAERSYGEERCLYGIGMIGAPPGVSGSFQAPVMDVDALLSGIDIMLALIRDDGNSYFKIHVVRWPTSSPTDGTTTRVDFVGTQVG